MKGAHKGRRQSANARRRNIDGRMKGGNFEAAPRGCQNCFDYLSEISRLTSIIQGLKAKVSYYEKASEAVLLPKGNPYGTFNTKLPSLDSTMASIQRKPEKSPSFNRRKTSLHVYPPTVTTTEKKGNPIDWYSPDVLIAPPDYYSLENSGPSSDESETEEEEDDDTTDYGKDEGTEPRSQSSSVSSSSYARRNRSGATSEKTESTYDDDGMASSNKDNESEQSVLEDDEYDFRNCFPFEENLFALSRNFQIEDRIGTGDDAIVYKATERSTGELVAIKFRDEWNQRGKHPKELRLLSAVQGHPITCDLVCWHDLPGTKCHAIVTKLCPNTDIEQYVFGDPLKIRKYMHDLMEVIRFLHERNILYRDVKPDNVLWDEDNGRLKLIDFDVATFYDSKRLHRRLVGTDGYMAPEVLAVSSEVEELEKQERYRHRKNRDELLSKLSVKGYGLQADVYSCGVLFGQLIFSYPQEDIMDDDMTERSGEGMYRRARKRFAQLSKLKKYTELETSDSAERDMTKDEYREYLALDLCIRMLEEDPDDRFSVMQSLKHEYFTDARAFEALPKRLVPYNKKHSEHKEASG